MKKVYISPSICVHELSLTNNLLTTSYVPVGGEGTPKSRNYVSMDDDVSEEE